jgi:tetratricopeptide (TPR) repeat protein
MSLSLNWTVALVAAFLWAAIVGRYVVSNWGLRREGEGKKADKEAAITAWSEALTREVMDRFPRSAGPAAVYAWQAFKRKDYEEALRRYQEAIRRDPRDIRGYTGIARVLRDTGRFDEADASLRQAQRRFPSALEVHADLAWLAQQRGDWPEAVRRWEAFRTRFPKAELGYHHGAAALRKAGRVADADALLAEAAARFPAPAPATTAGR